MPAADRSVRSPAGIKSPVVLSSVRIVSAVTVTVSPNVTCQKYQMRYSMIRYSMRDRMRNGEWESESKTVRGRDEQTKIANVGVIGREAVTNTSSDGAYVIPRICSSRVLVIAIKVECC